MSDIRLSDLMRTRYLDTRDAEIVGGIMLKRGEPAALEAALAMARRAVKAEYEVHVRGWKWGTVKDAGLDERMEKEISNACQNQRRAREAVANRDAKPAAAAPVKAGKKP